MKIASWNVNSINMRLPILLDWLEKEKIDIVLLQEIKSLEKNFPKADIEALDYHIILKEQKGFNGVAILSKKDIKLVNNHLPGDDDDHQARFLQAEVNDVTVICIYLPNGNPVHTDKYTYKLSWMKRLEAHIEQLLREEVPFLIGGDFNVIPAALDVYNPKDWEDDALYCLPVREAYRRIVYKGLVDAYRMLHPDDVAYTFWDYQAGRWPRDEGIRIDHFLLSPIIADRLQDCQIDRSLRSLEKPSDHTPIICTI